MLTSADQLGDAARCRTLGIDAYLVKPVRVAALREAIARALAHAPVAKPAASRPTQAWDVRRVARRVLLAEDNIVNQRVAAGILQKAGHQVTIVGNGKEALSALEASRFDVVLMDIQMPGMGGAEAMTIIRAKERETGGHQPIIALTAHAMKGDREVCLKAGADGYVSKPLSARDLLDQIDTFTEGRNRTLADKRRQLLRSVNNDGILAQDIIRLFEQDAPRQLRSMRDAIAAADGDAVYRAAHTLRGSVTNFGNDPLLDSLGELEAAATRGDMVACDGLSNRVASETATLLEVLRLAVEPLSCAS